MTATENSDLFLLSWFKDRAGGILLTAELELGSATALQYGSNAHISAPRAVECLIALRKRLIPHADPSERDRLLLVHHKAGATRRKASADAVTCLSEAAQNQAWHRFRRRHPILAEYPITLDLIRTTILLKEALESGNSILRVQRKAQHASPTTSARYVENHATHLLNQGKVREVQEFMFASATRGHDEIRTAFGLTSERADTILAKARKKGFGGWQHQSVATADEAPDKEGTIAHWITHGENFIVEDKYVAAEMHAFRRHIIAETPSLRSSPSWYETWAPLLLLLNVALQKMNADTRLRGEAIADEFEIVYGDLR
ncbi:hypothetical protein [Manganibacter manganicus]|uniref:Uncharacterized protein n=1 Tax=Manganibacter manganicus TaxID=1873176 RepID=A0A1V8RN15_9HYPH|nr:hypothetical protein [Pseudaminobacter manganicus]OQM74580.1 hypothetical protein BFN67_21435 [Pseudaminobacter manganicus]